MENNLGYDHHPLYFSAYCYFYKPLTAATTSTSPLGVGKVYPCTFCPKKFANPRALGGHQNAHKKERRLSHVNPPPSSPPSNHIKSSPVVLEMEEKPDGKSSKQIIKSSCSRSFSKKGSSSCSRQLGWKEQLQLFEEAAAEDDQADLISWSGSTYVHPPLQPSDDSNGSAKASGQLPDQADYSLDLDLHL